MCTHRLITDPAIRAAQRRLARLLVALSISTGAVASAEESSAPIADRAPAAEPPAAAPIADPAPPPSPAESELLAGWDAFQAGRFPLAERHYLRARSLGDPSGEATLGLAWTWQRSGRCEEARPLFVSLLAQDPGSTRAADGLRACPPPRTALFTPQLVQGLYIYKNHPLRNLTSATLIGLDVWLKERWLLSAAYRFSYFTSATAQSPAWLQHDVFAHVGYATRTAGLTAHYAILYGALNAPIAVQSGVSDYAQTSHHVGVSGRISPFGDGVAAVAWSFYPTLSILRAELSWRFPLPAGFSLRPAGSLQVAQGSSQPYHEFNQNVALTAAWERRRFSAFLGGKYGSERRPVYLDFALAYNGPERVSYGLLAGFGLRPGRGFSLALGYAWDHLFREADATSAAINSEAHYLTFSLSKEL
ncbi:MAG: hypothetical protein U1A78_18550 [Polyangia bacterium]